MADEEKGKGKAAQRLGFDDKGNAYPGVNPETGERVNVNLDALKSEFGPKRGEEMFLKVAAVAGGGNPSLTLRAADYPGGIGLVGADKAVVERVNEILSAKE